jgi:hypothetical protein
VKPHDSYISWQSDIPKFSEENKPTCLSETKYAVRTYSFSFWDFSSKLGPNISHNSTVGFAATQRHTAAAFE